MSSRISGIENALVHTNDGKGTHGHKTLLHVTDMVQATVTSKVTLPNS